MASATNVAKRIPLIKFPSRKAARASASHPVSRGSSEGSIQTARPTPPSMPSGTASSQPYRTKLTDKEIEAILLGGAAP